MLTASNVVKWGGLAFGALPGRVAGCFTLTSRFLPARSAKVTIYATQISPFSFFLSSFVGEQGILGYGRPRRIVAVHPPQRGKKKAAFVGCIWRSLQIKTAFERRRDVIGLQMRPPKDADPELRRSKRDKEGGRKPCALPKKWVECVCVCVCVSVCVCAYPVRQGQTPQTAGDSSSPRCRRPPAPL